MDGCVSSLGGPRVLLPSEELDRWISELDAPPTPDRGLYGMACSVRGYCGEIRPWQIPFLIFGDGPDDIFFNADRYDGLFYRWVAADAWEQLSTYALECAESDTWDTTIEFEVATQDLLLIDSCYVSEDVTPSLSIRMDVGRYRVRSRYAESESVMTVVHRFDLI